MADASKPGYVDGNTEVFGGTVLKIDKDGNQILSDRVGKGEKLVTADSKNKRNPDAWQKS